MNFKKTNKKFLLLIPTSLAFIFLGLYGYDYFQDSEVLKGCFGQIAQAQEGCVTVTTSCTGPNIAAANLSWVALTNADISPGQQLTSVNYVIYLGRNPDLAGAEARAVGNVTSYYWPGLSGNTTYYWQVKAHYTYIYGGWLGGSGTRETVIYSFSTPFSPINNPPTAKNLRANLMDGCLGCYYIFSWDFSDPDPGNSQSAYRVQADDNSGFNSPEIDSGKITGISGSSKEFTALLSWNTRYFWRLMVWDNQDLSSAWITGPSFTTPLHRYPEPDFSWLPKDPIVNQSTHFTDKSQAFGGASIISWSWTFQDGEPSSSSFQNPITRFLSVGSKKVTLSVWDSDNLGPCRATKIISISKFPFWEGCRRELFLTIK